MPDQSRTLRTPESQARYKEEMSARKLLNEGCGLCKDEAVELFTYWKIIPNEFPYDKIAEKHDMIVPLRHTGELSDEEWEEFELIKKNHINERYRYIIEATHRTKSIPEHFHLHLIEIK